MPLAYAVGRRSILLVSTLILCLTSALCAAAKTYEWHLAVRLVMGLAAGQSEALVPMITQVWIRLVSGSEICDSLTPTMVFRNSFSCMNAARTL